MKFNIPTILTLFRVGLIPFFIVTFYLPFHWAPFLTTIIFFIASITDWLDGYLARRWNQSTPFGAFLDPVADKVMVIAALTLVVEYQHVFWVTIPAIIMIFREIVISALREWMAEIGSRGIVAVSWLGKIKTASQMLALGGLLWHYNTLMEITAIVFLYIAAMLTVWSMFQYLAAAKKYLLADNKQKSE
ncbi:CDP-diacylglycerol--glycerol-3-phosphate 3-phosphatidyltransferase [Histophilus somni]|uniref:CDP-diacylglycerol--glycerol-3-phosphate 3-phosphatidyltransferase n=1 Tax=Histophilus somni TaxID=731 RepID=A0A9Q6P4Z9_HISSO|nr:CDP-diacylglycerol--glycerol-3-phosphate 3-phosphatidyltransferase [Histophilus somni]ACA30735.1 CDP-diacylglycerol--glycerol-3-phosphate 3-phosphatidyltransferase [Histophilus somni 2336]ARU65153.1 CDP-diacylglycerol--glycerol-3-phosphate 3-phosphatidyltransferase [Histophilus somni]ARU67018.1 CDP-diacylglycerol--glycerol-3-phosphate 3-phosphatidyltransferase [Histophilus somni]ARU68889.1 CDP-diacylglycerol--glycerol-3-phosphate 3-phosphatidyltransferase [Histophilus somni]ARU70771.1 CDP-d